MIHRRVYYRDVREGKPRLPYKSMTKEEFEKFLKVKEKKTMSEAKRSQNESISEIFKSLALSDMSARQEEIFLSLEEQFKEKGYLTEKQKELLIQFYEKVNC